MVYIIQRNLGGEVTEWYPRRIVTKLRKSKGLTQEELAEDIGVSYGFIEIREHPCKSVCYWTLLESSIKHRVSS